MNHADVILPTQEGMTSVRWKSVAPVLLILWIVNLWEKIGVGIIMTNHQFLADMNLLGRDALTGSLASADETQQGQRLYDRP